MIDYYVPTQGAEATRLDSTTNEFLDTLKKGDPTMKTDRSSSIKMDGKPALLTRLTAKTSNGQDQVIFLYTTQRQAGLWYMIQAAAPAQLAEIEPTFRQMAQTIVFPADVP